MDTCAVESMEMNVPAARVHEYVADRSRLPEWTLAFEEVSSGSARMRTPRGEVEVALRVDASRSAGTVDWTMRFPDGSEATAFSRVVRLGPARSIFSFILPAPALPLEKLEGTLAEQRIALREELRRLRERLEGRWKI